MDDFSTRIPDFLESATEKIRSMTVDRVARILTFLALGLVAATLVGAALVFLMIGFFRILGELADKICDCDQSMEIAYAVVGGLFLALGALLWSKRKPKERAEPA